jgi:carboxylesterase type B
VTIFGESAGGFSVKQLLAQPPSPLPFRAAIMESQNALIIGDPALNYANVVAHFNCTTAPSQIACLRDVSGTAIQSYITEAGLFFGPVVDKTNVNANTLGSITSGQIANVPILIGSNKDEFRVFSALFGLNPAAYPNLATLVLDVLGLDISTIATPLATLYGAATNLASDQVNALLTDVAFTCPTQTFSTAIAAQLRQPVYRYYFEGDFPNVRLFPNAGAYHSVEIPEVWGTYPLNNELGAATPNQIALSSYMQGVWAGFAKDPSAGTGWPRLGSTLGAKELGVLGGKGAPAGEQTRSLAYSDLACPLINPVNIAAMRAF